MIRGITERYKRGRENRQVLLNVSLAVSSGVQVVVKILRKPIKNDFNQSLDR